MELYTVTWILTWSALCHRSLLDHAHMLVNLFLWWCKNHTLSDVVVRLRNSLRSGITSRALVIFHRIILRDRDKLSHLYPLFVVLVSHVMGAITIYAIEMTMYIGFFILANNDTCTTLA